LTENTRFSRRQTEVAEQQKISTSDARKMPAKQYTKLYIRVPNFECKEYLKAKNIVDIFDGDVRVIFYDVSASRYSEYSGKISASEYILSELRDIVGAENIVPK
jgi:hypothetical protein